MGFGKKEKRIYARAMRRLEYGYLGYAPSLFRSVHLTTREGDENTRVKFLKDHKKLIDSFEAEGYNIKYCGVVMPTPQKGLMHSHELWRIKGGYFIHGLPDKGREAEKEVGKRWLKYHNAYKVEVDVVRSQKDLKAYISKHILKGFVEERVRLNMSKGWTRSGLKEAQEIIKRFVHQGRGTMLMSGDDWKLYREIEDAFCRGENHLWTRDGSGLWVHEFMCEFYEW